MIRRFSTLDIIVVCHVIRLPHCQFGWLTVWSRLPIHTRYLVFAWSPHAKVTRLGPIIIVRSKGCLHQLHRLYPTASLYIYLFSPFGCSCYEPHVRNPYCQNTAITSLDHESQACLYITSSHFGASTTSATILRRSVKTTVIAHEANSCHHHGGLVLVRFAAR